MYHRQSNKTALQSQKLITGGLFRLMRRKPFSQITITELCREADMGRKTFYRNFDRKEDVVDFYLDLLRERYGQRLRQHSSGEQLRLHFTFLKENADQFILLYQNGFHQTVSEKFNALLSETMPIWSADPTEQQYRSRYIVAGIEALQRVWVERGFAESIDEIMDIVRSAQDRQIPLKEAQEETP